MAVSAATGALTSVISWATGAGVASLGFGAGGSAAWIVLAAGFYRLRAPAELDAERVAGRDAANAARDLALAERDEARAGGRMSVNVTRQEPHDYGDSILFRLIVHNVGSRRATYSAEVVDIEGTTPHGPETPFDASWRGTTNKPGHCSIALDSEQMIDVASGLKIDEHVARATALERWHPPFTVFVGTDQGRADHPVPQDGVESIDQLLQHELFVTIRIVHEESQEPVARTRMRLWYIQRDGALLPQMEIDERPR